jgi:hypothetical protein
MVTGAADAQFVLLEHAGVLGALADGQLAGHAANGLAVEAQAAQVVLNEPYPLSPHPSGNSCVEVTCSRCRRTPTMRAGEPLDKQRYVSMSYVLIDRESRGSS